jgi:phosphomannomutase
MLSRIASHYGVCYAETLTGFKWLANAALAHDGPFVIGFEEALGYSAGEVVRDKDGVSAALLLVDLAAWCKNDGRTLLDELTELSREHGCYVSRQHAIKLSGELGARRIRATLAMLRETPPTSIGGSAVNVIRDVHTGRARDLRTGEETDIALPQSNVLAFELADGSRVIARPSGTEPKLKFYFEVCQAMTGDDTLATAEARANSHVDRLMADVLGRAGL